MVFVKYDFPLPNNEDRYDFSQEELHKLLDSVYERGYTQGVEVTNKIETIVATATISNELEAYVDVMGDTFTWDWCNKENEND